MDKFCSPVLSVCTKGHTSRQTPSLQRFMATFCAGLQSSMQALHYKNWVNACRLQTHGLTCTSISIAKKAWKIMAACMVFSCLALNSIMECQDSVTQTTRQCIYKYAQVYDILQSGKYAVLPSRGVPRILFLKKLQSHVRFRRNFENIGELPQFMMASTGSLIGKESVWAYLSAIEFGSPNKLSRLDQDELVPKPVYLKLALTQQAMASLYKKHLSATVAGERYGFTLTLRLCPHARVTASWCAGNRCIDPSLMRPGIVCHYIV